MVGNQLSHFGSCLIHEISPYHEYLRFQTHYQLLMIVYILIVAGRTFELFK